jgi:hypothetical protein
MERNRRASFPLVEERACTNCTHENYRERGLKKDSCFLKSPAKVYEDSFKKNLLKAFFSKKQEFNTKKPNNTLSGIFIISQNIPHTTQKLPLFQKTLPIRHFEDTSKPRRPISDCFKLNYLLLGTD